MRILNENEMVELLEATPDDRAHLARRMDGVVDADTLAWLAKNIQDKTHKVTTVVSRGRKLGAIWWWFSASNKSLVLNAGASFVQGDTTPAFMMAYEILAKQVGAVSLELQTARAGVAKIYRKLGWKIEGLAMRKML